MKTRVEHKLKIKERKRKAGSSDIALYRQRLWWFRVKEPGTRGMADPA